MPARALAREIARAYGGRVKRDELSLEGVPACEFRVKDARRGARPLDFRVFEGGCAIEGATSQKPPIPFALNRRFFRMDRPVAGMPAHAMRAYRNNSIGYRKDYPAADVRALEEYLAALWRDDKRRRLLLELHLTRHEGLLLLEHPLFEHGLPAFWLLHHSEDLAILERRFEILEELFPPPGPEALLTPRVSERAYRIKIEAAATGTPHRFGGKLDPALPCPNCGTPIHRILHIDTGDPALRLPALGRRHFPVVFCLNCMSWDTLYADYGGEALRVVRLDKAEKVNDDGAVDERSLSLRPIASPRTSASKVGGSPFWIQGAQVPECARCARPMAFFAQLKSLPGLGFGDEGVLYSFVCTDCKVSASLIQSH
jgi:hypothetical protein